MRTMLGRLLLLAALCAAAPLAAQGSAARYPDTPAGRRLAEVVGLLNGPADAALRAYVADAYAPPFLAFAPVEVHAAYFYRLHDQTRGVELAGIQESTPTKAVALLRARLTGELLALGVTVDSTAEHRIARLGQEEPRVPAALARPAPSGDAGRVRELSAFMAKLGEAGVFPGVVLLARGDSVLFGGAWGLADRETGTPVEMDTRFSIASMGKMLTAVAVAQLVEEGRLRYDDPLSKFMPGFPDSASARKIRIGHLLSHTSGLGDYFNRPEYEATRATARTVDEMLAWAAGDSLAFEPGTEWRYSNVGYLALGRVIERVTGRSYFDHVRDRVLRPAGMAHTDFDELTRARPGQAVGYEKEYAADGARYRSNLAQQTLRGGPAGGVVSTAGDLLRFARALRSGTLVRPETLRRMTSPKPELGSPHYGFGFETYRPGMYGHSGSFPGVSAGLEVYPRDGYVLVILSNQGGAAGPVLRRVWSLLPSHSE